MAEATGPMLRITARTRGQRYTQVIPSPEWDQLPVEALVPMAAVVQGAALHRAKETCAMQGLPAPKLATFTWQMEPWAGGHSAP